MAIPIPPEAATALMGAVKKGITTVLVPSLLGEVKKFWGKDHGSKVKDGAFKECPIEMFGDMAYIVVNPDKGELILLTSDNIQSYRYVKEKVRGVPRHTYFYYEITFQDGTVSFVRMRRKYRDAMLSHT